ncbi:ABC transporter, substrate-binding protein [Lachnospiraceae bacterium KM106-2]|nr:ABC transporter, substrate-binding protein [Lachnospiraceae bacterium KM106-2]
MLLDCITEHYQLYVTPRMKPFILISSICLIFMALEALRKIRWPIYGYNYNRYLIYMIFLLLLTIPMGQQKPSQVNQSRKGSTETMVSPTTKPQATPKIAKPQKTKKKSYHIKDEDFYEWICMVYENPQMYKGSTVTIKGMIYLDPSLSKKNYFSVVRLAMVCCSADLMPVGPICNGISLKKLKQDEYVTITGTIDFTTFEGEQEPLIHVTKIQKASAPKEPYIYP